MCSIADEHQWGKDRRETRREGREGRKTPVFPFSVWDPVGPHSQGLPSRPLHWPPNSFFSLWSSAISNPSFFLPIDNFQTLALSLASGEAFEVSTPSNIWLLTGFFPGFDAHVYPLKSLLYSMSSVLHEYILRFHNWNFARVHPSKEMLQAPCSLI